MSVPRLIHDVEFPDLGVDDVLQGEPVLASGCVGIKLEEFIPVFPRAEDGVLEGLEFVIEGFEFWGWGDPVGSVILDLHGLPVDGFAHEFTSLSCVDGDCIMFCLLGRVTGCALLLLNVTIRCSSYTLSYSNRCRPLLLYV